MTIRLVSVNRWIVFNWNFNVCSFGYFLPAVSVNRWIVFNWNLDCQLGTRCFFVSVNRWIVFNWNLTIVGTGFRDQASFS